MLKTCNYASGSFFYTTENSDLKLVLSQSYANDGEHLYQYHVGIVTSAFENTELKTFTTFDEAESFAKEYLLTRYSLKY